MKAWQVLLIGAALAGCASLGLSGGFEPEVGQPGKDVIWMPTPPDMVQRMLDMAKVTAADYVIDLGSGDGRMVIAAAKRGARSLGIEYNPDMVDVSRRNANAAAVGDRAEFLQADIFRTDLSRATVVTMFLLTNLNLKLRPSLLALKPGTRVLSNTFRMGEWEPDESVALGCGSFCTSYLWIIPAQVEGLWRTTRGDLVLKQDFQLISGKLGSEAASLPIILGRLRGDEIGFASGGAEYRGRVSANVIEGTVRSGTVTVPWRAER